MIEKVPHRIWKKENAQSLTLVKKRLKATNQPLAHNGKNKSSHVVIPCGTLAI